MIYISVYNVEKMIFNLEVYPYGKSMALNLPAVELDAKSFSTKHTGCSNLYVLYIIYTKFYKCSDDAVHFHKMLMLLP